MSVRVRYAPSPTGSPHVGNIRTAIFNWLFARKEGGVFIARLEDTDRDPERYQPESIGQIEQSLNGLGITPDEWWKNRPARDYVQSERLDLYQAAARTLIESGWAYPCFCTSERLAEMRSEQQASGQGSGYDRRCRNLTAEDRSRLLAEGRPHTVRLAVPLEGSTTYRDVVYGEITFENRLIDDQVLLKSNGWPTYHLAVVVDDHEHGITHVIRGEDWQPSTPKQILLYKAFEWDQPDWVHCPLIIGMDRKKLGKRHGSTKFVEFLDEGYLPEAMFNFLVLCGWSPGEENREILSRDEIVARFSLEGIGKSPAIFDYDKLRWMNGEYIRALSPEDLADRCLPFLQLAGLVKDPASPEERSFVARVIPLVSERLKVLSDVAQQVEFFYRDPTDPDEKGKRKWLAGPEASIRLQAAIEMISGLDEVSTESAEKAVDRIAERLDIERGPVIHTLRVAVTGRTVGPGLFELLSVLGKDRILGRLHRAQSWIE